MSRVAIISDIHGNLEALRAVLQDIDGQDLGEIICLGDIVGYGPDPCECADIVRERCSIVIKGNHDDAAIHGPVGFNPLARDAIKWTQSVLRPRLLRPQSRQRWTFLEELPSQAEWESYLLVHGSPRDPTSEYIMERDVVLGNEPMFREVFEGFETLCFVGHTHMPGVFADGERTTWRAQRQITGPVRFEGTKLVINVGSVGQPRDRDPRACYVTVDSARHEVAFRRITYDVAAVQRKMRAIPALDGQLADRLAEGI